MEELVEVVLEGQEDPAVAEFDAALTAAATAGLASETVRALRFWHRQSLANARLYAAHAVPQMFALIDQANAEVADEHGRARAVAQSFHKPLPRYPAMVVLPDVDSVPKQDRLEERRRTVAARLSALD